MKKLVITMALFAMCSVANAAAFQWKAGNVYGADLTTKWSGQVTLYATGIAEAIAVTTASSGAINYSFSSTVTTAGTDYDFYFVIVDGGKTFTSSTKTVGALDVGTANITFGNMASQTQNASNWAGSSPVPEPTSGMLMLLGMAGLALRRRRA